MLHSFFMKLPQSFLGVNAMKKSLLIAVFASASLLCSASIAQEAGGSFAPPPEFNWNETKSDVQPQLTADEQRRSFYCSLPNRQHQP